MIERGSTYCFLFYCDCKEYPKGKKYIRFYGNYVTQQLALCCSFAIGIQGSEQVVLIRFRHCLFFLKQQGCSLFFRPHRMNPSLQALNDFVNDFNLRRPNGVIAFTARIQFNTSELIESEVQVITSDNVGAVYFLNIPDYELPDMFSVKKNVFEYVPQQCLKIESGAYAITVLPVP